MRLVRWEKGGGVRERCCWLWEKHVFEWEKTWCAYRGAALREREMVWRAAALDEERKGKRRRYAEVRLVGILVRQGKDKAIA